MVGVEWGGWSVVGDTEAAGDDHEKETGDECHDEDRSTQCLMIEKGVKCSALPAHFVCSEFIDRAAHFLVC